MQDTIFSQPRPTIGLVIGTFAAVPYVHLGLEARRHYFPDVPVLVNDDGSPFGATLQILCRRHGIDFIANNERKKPFVGDLTAFVQGLKWARESRLDVLVKFSRRFVPLYNWVPDLQQLCIQTQYATYSHECKHFNFGFRTECIALHVESWFASGVFEKLEAFTSLDEPIFVEGFMHDLARDVHKSNCRANRKYERYHRTDPDKDAYGKWDLTGTDRTLKRSQVLWHNCDNHLDYARISRVFGLPYVEEDYKDPNQGCGNGK